MVKRGSGSKAKGNPQSRRRAQSEASGEPKSYDHPEATAPSRPDIGVQKQFRKKKPPKTYRYDPSLSPSLQWDEQPARERGEALIRKI